MSTADVVIVGAGVVGASTALELSKAGYRVTVVDREGGAGLGSTGASSAIVRFNYSTHDGVASAWESHSCWLSWAEHLGATDPSGMASLVPTGMVMLDSPVAPPERFAPMFDELGVPYQLWDGDTLRTRVPGIDSGRYWPPKPIEDDAFFADATGTLGGIYTPDAGYIDDPHLAARNLAYACERRGTTFCFNRSVTAITQAGGRVSGVRLSDGTSIDAPVVINAAGPASSAINAIAGVGAEFTIGVRALRQEVHQLPAPHHGIEVIVIDLDLGAYIRPSTGGFVLVGGTEPACDPLEWVDDPEQFNPRATVDRFETQVTRAARRFPELAVPNTPVGIAGLYDVTDDWTPIYDRTDLEGFYVAMGTSGNQFKTAPVVGRFMATLVDAVENGHDHDADPLTWTGEHTGAVISLGAFSRQRQVNHASSNTVMG